jgi:hypothetical protein
MSGLREDLSLQAARFVPGREAYERVLRRVARRRLIRRVATGAAAFVIAVMAFAGLWATSRSSDVPVGSPTPNGSTTPSPSAAVPPEQLGIGLRTHVDGWVVLPDGFGVWVAGAGRLFDVDRTNGDVTQTAQGMNWDYDYVRLAEYGEGTIFAVSGSTLYEIAAESGTTIRRFDLGSLGLIHNVFQTNDPSATWVTADGPEGGVLARIDLDNGRVLNRYAVGSGAGDMAEADGFLFVETQTSAGGGLLRLDPSTGDRQWIHGISPDAIAGIGHTVWVAEGDHVHCIDAALPAADCPGIEITRATALVADGACLPQGVGRYGDCRVWVLSRTGSTSSSIYLPDPDQPATVTLVDATTGEVLGGPLPLPDVTPATISAFDGHAWVGFHDSGLLLRIDATR